MNQLKRENDLSYKGCGLGADGWTAQGRRIDGEKHPTLRLSPSTRECGHGGQALDPSTTSVHDWS